MGLGRSVGGRLSQGVAKRGPAGAQGPAGQGAVATEAWAWAPANGFGAAASITDWGPVFNAMVAAGIHSIGLAEHLFEWTTPIDVSGQATHVTFQGAHGRGWYVGAAIERVGTRLRFKGGASPTVTRVDGAMTNGSAVLTSASGPFTNGGGASNVYHIGQPITVVGAGAGGTNLVTQIIARSSSTSVTLADTAGTTVAAASFTFTDWTRAINALGSSGVSFRDCKITYDSPAFDGILVDMRSNVSTWSARGELDNCLIGGDTADFTDAGTVAASACRAYALVHLCGMGEHFKAKDVTFGLCKAAVRGMYQNNTDDAHFDSCHFVNCIEGAVVNPGRFWKFSKCSSEWSGGNPSGPYMGPVFGTDGPSSIQSVFHLDDFSAWDFGQDRNPVGGSITNGSTTLTITNLSKIGTYTEDMFWKDRLAVVQGAGPGGTDLKTRILKRLSATTLQLRDAASTTVANGYWMVGDGGFMYQKPGFNWDVKIDKLMTWLSPSPEFELLGAGKIVLADWWCNHDMRVDIPGFAEAMRFSSNPAGGNKFSIDLKNTGFGSNNLTLGVSVGLANVAGHDIISIDNTAFSFNGKKLPVRRHRTWGGVGSNQGQCPSVVAAAGVALSGGVDVWGNDERGVITIVATGAGIAAGLILDMTFADAWPTLFTAIANSTQAPFFVKLTPYEHGPNDGSGASAAKAGLYAKATNTVHTGLSFGIANAIVGAQTLAFSYEIVRL